MRVRERMVPASSRQPLWCYGIWLIVNCWFAPDLQVTGALAICDARTSTDTPQMFAAALMGIVTATLLLFAMLCRSTFTKPFCWADAAGAAAKPMASMPLVTKAANRILVLLITASMASSLIV